MKTCYFCNRQIQNSKEIIICGYVEHHPMCVDEEDMKICYKRPEDYSDEKYMTECIHFYELRNVRDDVLYLQCIRAVYKRRNL